MILNGNQRSGGQDLALHLLKEENDHIEVHDLRGFVSDDLVGAFREAEAISKGTRCKQYLFSLSLNPPETELVTVSAFEEAIDKVEEKLGLTDQPRAIVFHEKNGRRHAHAVWSRIDPVEMKAVQLSHSHRKLREVSKELFREHGWEMPKGLIDRNGRDPKNFTLNEWQQARRVGKDPRQIKSDLHDAWAISDSKPALIQALSERGFTLARGARRGFVVLDRDCEIYALPKWLNIKTKTARERIGSPVRLPSVDDARAHIAAEMTPTMQRLEAERRSQAQANRQAHDQAKKALIAEQRAERCALTQKLAQRERAEVKARQERFRKGFAGAWDALRGQTRRIKAENEQDAWQSLMRDRAEKDALVFRHLEQRRDLRKDLDRQHADNRAMKSAIRDQQTNYDRVRELLERQARNRNRGDPQIER
jgi:MobA/VirD2-like, nuclease domain